MKDEKTEENRRIILDYIYDNPGSHLRLMSREIDMKLGTLRHHLRSLEKENRIISRREKNLKTYFFTGSMGTEDKNISSLLRQKRFRNIVITVILNPGINHKSISDKMKLKPSTLTKYLRVLEEREVLYHAKDQNEKHYFPRDEERILSLLKLYKKSLWDSYIDNALELFFEQ